MIYCITCGNKLEEQWSICPICSTPIQAIIKPEPENILPSQGITTPYIPLPTKRTKRNKKRITITILLVVGFFIGGISLGFVLTYPSLEQAKDSRDYWYNEYNDLAQDYDNLLDDYNTLISDYSSLFGQYQSILSVLDDPLVAPIIPTIDQVQSWLSTDDTDEHEYIGNEWMCGDFAAMLMVKAKANNWRMRIAIMSWSYNGEDGWDNPYSYGSYGHAFNLIYCQDGDDPDNELDIFYIEPQSDTMWWLNYGDDNHFTHYTIWSTFSSSDYSGRVWTETYYVNYYNYFA